MTKFLDFIPLPADAPAKVETISDARRRMIDLALKESLAIDSLHRQNIERAIDRNSWCTPKWLAERLPEVALDPCSNKRSHIKASRSIMLPDDGLSVSWHGLSIYCNPPYENVMPWAEKAASALSFIFLINVDPSTKWWQELTTVGKHVLLFHKRIAFDPPPGAKTTTNPRPQALVCSYVVPDLDQFGTWWHQ